MAKGTRNGNHTLGDNTDTQNKVKQPGVGIDSHSKNATKATGTPTNTTVRHTLNTTNTTSHAPRIARNATNGVGNHFRMTPIAQEIDSH